MSGTPTATDASEDSAPPDGPTCGICTHAFEPGQRVTQSPVCPCVYHSACALPFVAHRFSEFWNHIHCPSCYAVLYVLPSSHANSVIGMDGPADAQETPEAFETRMATLAADTTFKRDLKAVKTKLTAARKAGAAFKRQTTAAGRAWRQEIDPHVQAMRELKRDALLALKGHETHAQARSATAAWKRSVTVFQAKYKLKRKGMRRFFRRFGTWRWLAVSRYTSHMRRAFRLPWNLV